WLRLQARGGQGRGERRDEGPFHLASARVFGGKCSSSLPTAWSMPLARSCGFDPVAAVRAPRQTTLPWPSRISSTSVLCLRYWVTTSPAEVGSWATGVTVPI